MFSEILNIGLDLIIFGVLAKLYSEKRRRLEKLRDAPLFHVDANLTKALGDVEGTAVPLAVVRGSVRAIAGPLPSRNVPGLSGVIQVITTKEMTWWPPSWWMMTKAIQKSTNIVPFYLADDLWWTTTVEVQDVECLEDLPLALVYDRFTPLDQDSFLGSLFGWIWPRGIRDVEQILTEGTRLTGIGRLEVGKKGLTLRAPDDVNDFVLTRLTPEELFQKIEREAQSLKCYATIFACLGFMMAAWSILSWRMKRKKEGEKRALMKRLSEARQRRDKAEQEAKFRGESAMDLVPRCVICMSQPVELLVLECGHACMCLDCGEHIGESCPMCRSPIARTVPAFLP